MMAEESMLSEDYERVAERVTCYRKNRNQYIWGMALMCLYSIGDVVVDALLRFFPGSKRTPIRWINSLRLARAIQRIRAIVPLEGLPESLTRGYVYDGFSCVLQYQQVPEGN